jgi:hypothetical protein
MTTDVNEIGCQMVKRNTPSLLLIKKTWGVFGSALGIPMLLIEQPAQLLIFFSPIVLLHAPEYRISHSPGRLV